MTRKQQAQELMTQFAGTERKDQKYLDHKRLSDMLQLGVDTDKLMGAASKYKATALWLEKILAEEVDDGPVGICSECGFQEEDCLGLDPIEEWDNLTIEYVNSFWADERHTLCNHCARL